VGADGDARGKAARRVGLVQQVRERMLEALIQGSLRPGSVIQLSRLAEEYGVSRTPMREALNMLEREGLVQAIAYKGYLVRSIEPRDVNDVFFMRRLLEGAGARLAASQISEDALERLRMVEAPTTCTMTLREDKLFHDFHRAVIAAAGSARLNASFESVYNDVRRFQYAGIGDQRSDLVHAEHMQIVERLSERDPGAAQAAMEAHIDAMRERALAAWLTAEG
jgi:DNA-binding GntR family transcriptional regulator